MIRVAKKVGKTWGSCRFITTLTPDTFLRKIIVVSTTINSDGGETAIGQQSTINHFYVDWLGISWTIVKKHKSPISAAKFHANYCAKLGFTDAEVDKCGR